MLFVAIILSMAVLVASHSAARPAPQSVRWGPFIGSAVGFCMLPTCGGFLPTATILTSLALGVALLIWPRVRHRVRWFLPLSASTFAAACSVSLLIAANDMTRYAEMREKYPYESMEDRVPAQAVGSRRAALPELADHRLTELDDKVSASALAGYHRALGLKQIHEGTVHLFVNSPGFGMGRMAGGPSRLQFRVWRGDRPPDGPPSQPDPAPSLSTAVDIDWRRRVPSDSDDTLHQMHAKGILDFVNPAAFGFIKDRRRVAGFEPHEFSQPVPAPTAWSVDRVELVSVLLHQGPVVYLSDRLPTMDRVREAASRRLDSFEEEGLTTLRSGEDFVTAEAPGRLRMIGSIRNGKQCVGCHGGERGDLLGAFCYLLREEKK
jgi:hypothetical protein